MPVSLYIVSRQTHCNLATGSINSFGCVSPCSSPTTPYFQIPLVINHLLPPVSVSRIIQTSPFRDPVNNQGRARRTIGKNVAQSMDRVPLSCCQPGGPGGRQVVPDVELLFVFLCLGVSDGVMKGRNEVSR